MVQGCPAPGRRILFEHRKINHPQRRPTLGYEAAILSNFDTQRAKGIVDNASLVRTKENQIARLRARALNDAGYGFVGQEFQNWRLLALATGSNVINFDIRETLGTVTANICRVVIDDFTAHLCTAGHA